MEKRFVFVILAALLGGMGIQEFVIGNIARGVLGILFCWTCIPAIIAIVQIIKALTCGSDEKFMQMYPNCKL